MRSEHLLTDQSVCRILPAMTPAVSVLAPRERIVQTAARLFYAQGYHATGINQIIAEAQVAKASFYAHFTSKDDLAVFYLQRTQAERMERLRAFVETAPPARPRVLALFGFLTQWMPETDYRGCRSLRLLPEFPDPGHPAHQQIVEHKTNLRAFIRGLVDAAHHEQPLARGVEPTADQVYVLFEGAMVESALFRAPWPIAAARSAVEALLF